MTARRRSARLLAEFLDNGLLIVVVVGTSFAAQRPLTSTPTAPTEDGDQARFTGRGDGRGTRLGRHPEGPDPHMRMILDNTSAHASYV
jgi:hypothetical protein